MLQLAGIGVGILAICMGVNGLIKKEIALTGGKPLTVNPAKIAGIVTILIGLLAIAFCLIGIPLILGP